jgi:hypothetical protein
VDSEIELGNFLEELNQIFSDSSDQADFSSMIDEQELLESLKQTYNSWHFHFFKNGDVFLEMSMPMVQNLTEKFKWRFSEMNNDILFAGLGSAEYQSLLIIESYDEKNQIMKVRLNSRGQSSLQVTLWFKRIEKPNKKLYKKSKVGLDKKIIGTYSVKDIIGLELENSDSLEDFEVVDMTPQARMQNITFYSDGLYVIRSAQTNQALASGLLVSSLDAWMLLPHDMGFVSNARLNFLKNNATLFISNYWGGEIQVVLQKEKKMARLAVPEFNTKAKKKVANTYIAGSWRSVRNSSNTQELSDTWNEENIDEENYEEYFIIQNSVFYVLKDQKSVVFNIDAQGNISFAGLDYAYSAGKLTWNEKQKIYELRDTENNHYTVEKLSNDFVRIIIKHEVYGEIKYICEMSSDEMDFLNLAAEQMFTNSDWDSDWNFDEIVKLYNDEYRPLEETHPIFGTWAVSILGDSEPNESLAEEFFFTWDTITILTNGTLVNKEWGSESDELKLWTLSMNSDDTIEVLGFGLSRTYEIRFVSADEFEIKDPYNEEHHFKFTKTLDIPRYSIATEGELKFAGCWIVDSTVYAYTEDADSLESNIFGDFEIYELLSEFITQEKFCLNAHGKLEQTITVEITEGDDGNGELKTIEDFTFNEYFGSRAEQWYYDAENQELIINKVFSLEINKILSLTANSMVLEYTDSFGKVRTLYLSR